MFRVYASRWRHQYFFKKLEVVGKGHLYYIGKTKETRFYYAETLNSHEACFTIFHTSRDFIIRFTIAYVYSHLFMV